MARLLVLAFGTLTYFVFFGTLLYQIGFLSNLIVPKAINDGNVVPLAEALAWNVGLLGLFAIQHTIMARIAFKEWWTRVIPTAIERGIFVLLSSLLLLLMNWQWRPLPDFVWHVGDPIGRSILYAVSFAGWGLVLYSSFLIDHLDLFGLRQAWLYFKGKEYSEVPFKERVVYSWVRHPLMLGFMIAFWATPDMTQGHLLFAVVVTAYTLVGIQFEERTLIAMHGDDYRKYKERVSMIIPMPPRESSTGE